MSGKQQRSTATKPDYSLLAGKVSRRSSDASARNAAQAPAADPAEDTPYTDVSSTSAGGIFKGAAVQILQSERRLMSTGEITKLALERKLVKATGKTPENTMASALYTDVRKRGSHSPFFKPKEGLFGLKTWLAEVWLQEWLSKEGIAIEEYAPELADCPPAKKQRYARVQHKSDNHHHRTSHVSSRTTASATYADADSDSDEKASNLNLLLEAANEIEREDDRLEAKRAAPPLRPNVNAMKPPRGKKPPLRHLQVSDPAGHPGVLPFVGHPYPFMLKGVVPPMPPLGTAPTLPPFMNYPFLSPAMAQQLLTGTSPALAASAAHPLDPSRIGILPIALPFPHAGMLDPLAPIPPITPSISPTATHLAATSPAATAPLHLELTGRSIATLLKESHAAAAAAAAAAQQQHSEPSSSSADKENPNPDTATAPSTVPTPSATKAPVNILNLPLPTFDIEDHNSLTPALDPLGLLTKAATPDDASAPPSPPDSLADKPLPPASPATAPSPAACEDTSATTSIQMTDDLTPQDSAATATVSTQQPATAPTHAGLLRALPSGDTLLAAAAEARRALEPAGPNAMFEGEGEGERASTSGRASMDAAAARLGAKDLRQVTEATAPGAGASKMHEKINTYRQHIQLLERSLGNMHPQVGKAYVFLGRALQHEGSRWSLIMAQRALLRAWQILASVKTRVDQEQPASLNDFSYLMGHLQETQTHQALQLQQLQLAGVQAAAAAAASQQQQAAAKLPSAAVSLFPAPMLVQQQPQPQPQAQQVGGSK